MIAIRTAGVDGSRQALRMRRWRFIGLAVLATDHWEYAIRVVGLVEEQAVYIYLPG